MEKYNYYEAVKADVENYIEENISLSDYSDKDEAIEAINDELWAADEVTGNGSGSYTFNAWEAEENLCHNLDLLKEALEEFGGDFAEVAESPEGADVTIRCYLLYSVLCEVIDNIWEEEEEEEEA